MAYPQTDLTPVEDQVHRFSYYCASLLLDAVTLFDPNFEQNCINTRRTMEETRIQTVTRMKETIKHIEYVLDRHLKSIEK